MSDPKISVIVPVYNAEKYLRKCVDSIINQSYRNLEIVLVNDGSTDNSGLICDDYKNMDERIKVFHKANGGVAAATNVGLDNMTGDYVVFVDSDDYIEKNMLEDMLLILQKENADIVQCGIYWVDFDYRIIRKITVPNKIIEGRENILRTYLAKNEIGRNLATKLIKASFFENLRLEEGRQIVDVIAITELLNKCDRYVFTENCYYYNLRTPYSVSRGKFTAQKYDDIKYATKYFENFISKNCPALKFYNYFRNVKVAVFCYEKIYYSDFTDRKEELQKLRELFKKNYPLYKKSEARKCGTFKFRILIRIFNLNPKLYCWMINLKRGSNLWKRTKQK
ncbi:glycosyltransferase [Acetivibrio clariflavus]|uniref:glycosyltransferase family 2 protein n=1 Tax=Acetivibrio clariflavus TaxID=288965 RepID=UPI0031F49EF9